MMYSTGFGRRGGFDLKPATCAALILSAVLAGCSADITRFDSASFNLNDPEEAAPRPVEPVRSNSDYDNPVTRTHRTGPYGAGAGTTGSVEVAALPDASSSSPAVPAAAPPAATTPATSAQALPRTARRPSPAPSFAPAPAAQGEMIEVAPGDTLYGLSRRHQVSLAELMSLNGLTSPNLKPGQKLYLPAGKSAVQTAAANPQASYLPSAAPAVEAPTPALSAPSAATLARYNSTYVVKPGDSIYRIARAHKVPLNELQQVNNIANPLKVRPGTTLKVPQAYAMTAAADPAAVSPAVVAPATTAALPVAPVPVAPVPPAQTVPPLTASVPEGSAQPTIINTQKSAAGDVAAKGDKVALAAPQAAGQAAAAVEPQKLRWPAQGKIIAGFGGRPDGTHNDGINLSVPLGTEVHAAEAGVIAYAGSELKGYGNLVLVRHDNGWVTAYAHNEELLVKRGDRVKRGQVIAKAGKTGTVDQPQLHFELRQNSKPVDPTPFMEAQ